MLIYDDTIIFNDFYQKTLFSLDLQTGIQRWHIPILTYFDLELDKERQRIYTYKTYTTLSEIYAIDAKSGTIIWTNDESYNRNNYKPILLANDNLVGLGIWGDVRQLNIETGEFGPAINLFAYQVFRDGYAWLIRDKYVTVIDAITGNTYWQAVEVSPVVCCLRAVQTNDEVVIAIFDNSFTVYDRLSHEIRWTNTDSKRVGYPALTETVVYTLDIQGILHLFDVRDGLEIGHVNFEPPTPGHDTKGSGGDSISSSQLVADGNHLAIFFGDTDMLSIYEITLNPS